MEKTGFIKSRRVFYPESDSVPIRKLRIESGICFKMAKMGRAGGVGGTVEKSEKIWLAGEGILCRKWT